MKQQGLLESAGRNLAERINEIKQFGNGYVTVQDLTCSNLINGKCKINPVLPEIMGCGRNSLCGFHECYHAE